MTKRGLSGQMNLFDFWGDTNSEDSIVEMVSLVPEEPKVEMVPLMSEEPVFERITPAKLREKEIQKTQEVQEAQEDAEEQIVQTVSIGDDGKAPVMHKEILDKNGKVSAEISYLNYNKVYIRNLEYKKGRLFEFENSKEAVDFYITEMIKLSGEA